MRPVSLVFGDLGTAIRGTEVARRCHAVTRDEHIGYVYHAPHSIGGGVWEEVLRPAYVESGEGFV